MKKKIIIGSIIAVVILTLVSFSSVVGYSSVKSDLNIASPLFGVKNNKGDVSTNYIGKGEESNILLPTRNRNKVLIVRFVNRIKEMDDRTFEMVIEKIITPLKQKDDFQDINMEEIMLSLYQIRENPEKEKIFEFKDIDNPMNYNLPIDRKIETTNWFFCILVDIIEVFIDMLWTLFLFLLPTFYFQCPTTQCGDCQTLKI